MPASDTPIRCIVEIPKGSRNKYEYDPESGAIKLDRFISSSVVYPTDYGFVPETLSQDGDELDALVCVSEPTFPASKRDHPFLRGHKDLDPDRHSSVKGWKDRDEALLEIERSRKRFRVQSGAADS